MIATSRIGVFHVKKNVLNTQVNIDKAPLLACQNTVCTGYNNAVVITKASCAYVHVCRFSNQKSLKVVKQCKACAGRESSR